MHYSQEDALCIVDVQNDFADPRGSLYVQDGEKILVAINDEIARASAAGAFVVYTQDWHPESTPHFEKDGGVWPVHCVQGSWGAEFHPELDLDGPVVRKGAGGEDGYSGFTVRDPSSGGESATDLDRMLREHDTRRLVVAGLATDYCVKATALDGLAKGYEVVVLTDAVRGVDLEPGDSDVALRELAAAGATLA